MKKYLRKFINAFFSINVIEHNLIYQFILDCDGSVWDSLIEDSTWEAEGLKSAVHIGEEFWSVEAFLPYDAFPHALKPIGGGSGGFAWTGNFTRHRVSDKGHTWREAKKQPVEGSLREFQKMNTAYVRSAGTMPALADFAPIKFME